LRHLLLTSILSATVFAQVAVIPVAASEVVVVKPSNLVQTGWQVSARRGSGEYAVAEFITGMGTPPSGRGSFHMYVGHSSEDPLSKVYLGTNQFSGIKTSNITQLRLWLCPHHTNYHEGQPGTVEIAVNDGRQIRLFTFLPWGRLPTGYYGLDTWREVDLMSPTGSWVFTNTSSLDFHGNWTWLVNRYPGASIATPPVVDFDVPGACGTILGTGLNIKIGSGKAMMNSDVMHKQWWMESAGCDAYVDKLTVGYRDDKGVEIVKVFDFEAD
jgi:hypothetical protein